MGNYLSSEFAIYGHNLETNKYELLEELKEGNPMSRFKHETYAYGLNKKNKEWRRCTCTVVQPHMQMWEEDRSGSIVHSDYVLHRGDGVWVGRVSGTNSKGVCRFGVVGKDIQSKFRRNEWQWSLHEALPRLQTIYEKIIYKLISRISNGIMDSLVGETRSGTGNDSTVVGRHHQTCVPKHYSGPCEFHLPTLSGPRTLYILTVSSDRIVSLKISPMAPPEAIVPAKLCPICHEEDTVVRHTLKCNHTFHLHCIDTWLRKNRTCPLCRYKIY